MKILIVGSGGREHALAWKLNQSPRVKKLFIAPGNGGTAQEGENVAIKDDDIPALVAFARDKQIDLVVAGPELPLVLGLSEALKAQNIPCFGPDTFSSGLEGSKSFAKRIMSEAGVPTADFAIFKDFETAKEYVSKHELPVVIKADGLAAGKGVVVAQTLDEAIEALEECMVKKIFGEAGETVVVEKALKGEEASFLAFSDGKNVLWLPSAQDHKPVGEGDTGPNTGGMGAYSPAPILPKEKYEETANLAIKPIINKLAEHGHPFVGMLYGGLMIDGDEINLLEYNVRFGDPECQPLLMRLETDLAEIMLACVEGNLDRVKPAYTNKTSVCVVMAAGGYPGSYKKGMPITGIDQADELEDVKVFQAGTTLKDGQILSTGGRVLGITALGDTLADAQKRAYEAVDKISFDSCFVRRDIGDKGLR